VATTVNNSLDVYLPESVRLWFEETYYKPINERATMEYLSAHSREFLVESPAALYSDHGIVHVRDVATRTPEILDIINGVLIPRRPVRDLNMFMKSYGVLLAYLHDIGMRDFTPFARFMHPELATQWIFSSDFDAMVDRIWSENLGNLAWRLLTLARRSELDQPPEIVLRELMAMCVCHSKSKVPTELLSRPARLRVALQRSVGMDLRALHDLQKQNGNGREMQLSLGPERGAALADYYLDFEKESFRWIISDSPGAMRLLQDAVDTVRALRCADALRQRGTVQKTSGGYEIFVSQQTGNALCSLRFGDERLYLMELDDPLSAGEANVAASALTPEGDLRVAFHRGSFSEPGAVMQAAANVAAVLDDIYKDVIVSFEHPLDPALFNQCPSPERTAGDIHILLENTDDNPDFVPLVIQCLADINPAAAAQSQPVPSLRNSTALESTRYLNGRQVDWDRARRQALLDKVRATGQKVDQIDVERAFEHVREATLQAGEVLIEAGTPSGFVYLPLGEGLQITPLGGYQSISMQGWFPVGNTGVIRGATRNAHVVAQKQISVLIIPKDVYLKYWYWPYTFEEVRRLLKQEETGPA
jgi:hypothetical protein